MCVENKSIANPLSSLIFTPNRAYYDPLSLKVVNGLCAFVREHPIRQSARHTIRCQGQSIASLLLLQAIPLHVFYLQFYEPLMKLKKKSHWFFTRLVAVKLKINKLPAQSHMRKLCSRAESL